MNKFLYKTAQRLVGQFGDKVSDICIVLPNRRGGLFLKKYLTQVTGKTMWAPAIFSIEDFLSGISGLSLCDHTQVLFELFEVHRMIEKENARPFEEFLTWGQQLIRDFNEIDSYLVDPEQLFSYLTDARALSLWNLDQEPLTDFEKNYLHFYQSLYSYYQALTSRLLLRKKVYPGLLFRHVADQISSIKKSLPWEKIVFAGFNAMTKAEEKIIDELYSAGNAELLWDADEFYLANKQQEAGDFLRVWLRKWKQPEARWIGNDYATTVKNITITGVPYNIGQVKLCGEILSGYLASNSEHEEIAVVLMDEQLVIPLLNSLPRDVRDLNITMGLSLQQIPLYTLFDGLFRMHENVHRFKKATSGGKIKYYYRDVLRVLQHPYVTRMSDILMAGNYFALDELIVSIRSGTRIFLDKDELINGHSGLFASNLAFLECFFTPWKEPPDAVENMKKVIVSLRDSLIGQPKSNDSFQKTASQDIEMEYLFAFSKIIFQLSSYISDYEAVKNIETLHRLFSRIAEVTTLPFYGEPLKGIQVMGMLETRTLDFDNLVLLSVNEDLIPSGKTSQSFIPFDMRRIFHLPTYLHKNAVYGYHFYRLLQRAKNVHILYNTEPDDLGGGEKSRFVKQMINELESYNPGIRIEERILSNPPLTGEALLPVVVDKKGDVLSRMKELAAKGLSPTSLNHYRNCSLKFYFSAIMDLEEPAELEDTIDPKILGQSVHDVLMNLYKPVVNNRLTADIIDTMYPMVDPLAERAFDKKYHGADITYGKNLLLVNVAKIMVRNFLKSEQKRINDSLANGVSITVKFLEQHFEKNISIPSKKESPDIRLRGFIDRVDLEGNTWKIIDYKTGKTESKELKVKDWKDLKDAPELDKSFQLLTYAYLLEEKLKKSEPVIRAGIISLKKIRSGFQQVTLPGQDKAGELLDAATRKEFETVLRDILEELFDTRIPFSQTSNLEICDKCPFINLCGR